MKISYKDAGVDVQKGDAFVERIKSLIGSTYNENVKAGAGGFAALYDIGDRYLASGTDGVGTKLKIAQALDIHDSIGIDLVAMCVNDIICTGAKPLFFLDYLATGKLDLKISVDIVKGITQGCRESNCALIGGETAEMPGMYNGSEYDLAGFAVGEVTKEKLIDGKNIKEGDYIIALPSSGFHSNGFSLVRKVIKDSETELLKQCLTPTKIYVKEISELLKTNKVKGLAHITGGGFNNISRINSKFNYQLDDKSIKSLTPDFMKEVCDRTGLNFSELKETFNMGVGMVVISESEDIGGTVIGRVANL